MSGEGPHDDLGGGLGLLYAQHDIEAAHARHPDIEDHDVEGLLVEDRKGGLAIVHGGDLIGLPVVGQRFCQGPGQGLFVVADQYLFGHAISS